MNLNFNHLFIVDYEGNLEYYFENENEQNIVDFRDDTIFHLTVTMVYEGDPIFIEYQDVHHFIKKLNKEQFVDIGFIIGSVPPSYISEIILDYVEELEIDAILNHDYLKNKIIDEITVQLANKIIKYTYDAYSTDINLPYKSSEGVKQEF